MNNIKGGYVIVDCKGLDLTKGSTEQTITGIYKNVQSAMKAKKQILAENCLWGVLPVTPIAVFAIQLSETTICVTSSTLQVYITNADIITISNMVGD